MDGPKAQCVFRFGLNGEEKRKKGLDRRYSDLFFDGLYQRRGWLAPVDLVFDKLPERFFLGEYLEVGWVGLNLLDQVPFRMLIELIVEIHGYLTHKILVVVLFSHDQQFLEINQVR